MMDQKAKILEAIAKVCEVARETLTKNPDFYGSIRVNFHGGEPVNANIEESVMFPGEKLA